MFAKVTLNELCTWVFPFAGSSLGHTWSWHGWLMGVWHSPNEPTLSDIPIPIPCATQWWFWKAVIGMGVWPLYRIGPLQNLSWPSIYAILNLTNACVCNLNANAPIAAGIIFRGVPMGIYQCQWYELMSTGINWIVVSGISDGQQWEENTPLNKMEKHM